MFSYFLKCKKNTQSKNPKVVKTKIRKLMLLAKHTVRDNKKSKFIKEQEASELLSSLEIRTPFKLNSPSTSCSILKV